MCGRTSLAATGEDLREVFDLHEVPLVAPRYNICPTEPIATIRTAGVLEDLRWGLIPWFTTGPRDVGGKWINARAETIQTMRPFRDAFQRHRCLVVVDGFYEWITEGKRKRPFHIRRPDRKPFAFAGLWDSWRNKDKTELVESVTIITCASRGVVKPLHDRMPVVLEKNVWELWINGEASAAHALLGPREPEWVTAEVNPAVNNVRNKGAECWEEPIQGRLV